MFFWLWFNSSPRPISCFAQRVKQVVPLPSPFIFVFLFFPWSSFCPWWSCENILWVVKYLYPSFLLYGLLSVRNSRFLCKQRSSKIKILHRYVILVSTLLYAGFVSIGFLKVIMGLSPQIVFCQPVMAFSCARQFSGQITCSPKQTWGNGKQPFFVVNGLVA